jgi:hypothetical protein
VLEFILGLALYGLVVGALGRLLLIGRDPMTIWETLALGLGAAAISGIISRLIWEDALMPPLALTVLIASALVFGVRLYRARQAAPPVDAS